MDTNGEQQNHSLHCGSDTFFHRLKYLMCCFEAGGQRTISKYFLWNNHTGRKWGLWWKYSYFWLSLTHSALKNHWLHQWYTLGKTIPSFSNSFATIMPCSLVQVEGGRVNWCNAGLTVVTQDKEAAIWNIISMFKLWLKYMYGCELNLSGTIPMVNLAPQLRHLKEISQNHFQHLIHLERHFTNKCGISTSWGPAIMLTEKSLKLNPLTSVITGRSDSLLTCYLLSRHLSLLFTSQKCAVPTFSHVWPHRDKITPVSCFVDERFGLCCNHLHLVWFCISF